MSTDDKKLQDAMVAYQAKIATGQPILTHVIEPPFNMKVEDNMVHIDAPCLVMGDRQTAAVVRISLTAAAAKAMKEAFAKMTFSESETSTSPGIQ